jgi:hypothetical protein
VEVDRRSGKAGGGGDEPGLDLPRTAALADHEVAQHALAEALVVGRDLLAPRPVADGVAGRVAGL